MVATLTDSTCLLEQAPNGTRRRYKNARCIKFKLTLLHTHTHSPKVVAVSLNKQMAGAFRITLFETHSKEYVLTYSLLPILAFQSFSKPQAKRSLDLLLAAGEHDLAHLCHSTVRTYILQI
jgi:hypothetical protein